MRRAVPVPRPACAFRISEPRRCEGLGNPRHGPLRPRYSDSLDVRQTGTKFRSVVLAAVRRAGTALFLAVFGGACSGAANPGANEANAASGNRPADFELPALSGGSVRLSDHLGKDVVLLDFWATFCEPCLLAMPGLDELYRKQRQRGFVVLGVSLDEASSASRVRNEVQKLGITFPILLDQETRVVALYNPRGTAPYSVLIGRDGRVLRRQEGYTPADHDDLARAVDAALR
jgi:peroxiredoxin